MANIANQFKPGEVYNIGSNHYHSIEELSDTVIRATGADPRLAEHRESEVLTTRLKRVDNTKAVRDLGHNDGVDLAEGIRRTAEWMRAVYKVP